MKTYIRNALIALFVLGLLNRCCFPYCEAPCDGETYYYEDSYLEFYLLDSTTKQTLLSVLGRYGQKDVKLYTSSRVEAKSFSVDKIGGGAVIKMFPNLSPQEKDSCFKKAIDQTYYLYLDFKEEDTLKISFQYGKGGCGDEFKSLKVYYNGVLQHERNNIGDPFEVFDLFKN
jgi:hypothetical protein